MEFPRLSRRRLLGSSAAAWMTANWPGIVAAGQHAHQAAASGAAPRLEFFTAQQAAEVEAIAAQIIPTDDTPGAREAGVIYFIDRALARFDVRRRQTYLDGLRDLKTRCGGGKFSELPAQNQIELLQTIEKTNFFNQVRFHTIVGFFANPEHGGNRDHIGWKLIGFEDAFLFEPPFGHYDRDYREGGA